MKKFLLPLIVLLAGRVLADGPIYQVSPYMVPVLQSQNASQAATALGVSGGTTSLIVMTNVAVATTEPTFQGTTNTINALSAKISTNVFNVMSFGATHSGRVANYINVTNVGTGGAMVGSLNAKWTSSDVGDLIRVEATGASAAPTFSIITNVINSTLCEISNSVTALVTNRYCCIYGTNDDSSAIQSAINAAWMNGGGRVYIPSPGISNAVYLIETNFTGTQDAQILIPFSGGGFNNNSPTIEICGDNPIRNWGLTLDGTLGITPNQTALVEMLQGNNNNAATNKFGSSMFSSRVYTNAANNGGTIWPNNPQNWATHDFSIWTGYNTPVCALDYIAAPDSYPNGGIWNMTIFAGEPLGPAYLVNAPANTNSIGIVEPGDFNGTFFKLDQTFLFGFHSGVILGLSSSHGLSESGVMAPIDSRIQANAPPGDFFDLSIADTTNVLVAGPGSGGCTVWIHPMKSLQGTSIGEVGWFTNGPINAVNEQNGSFNTQYAEVDLPFTNAEGNGQAVIWSSSTAVNISYQNTPNNSRVFTHSQQVYNMPIDFNSSFARTTGEGNGFDYRFDNIWDTHNQRVDGEIVVTNLFAADNGENSTAVLEVIPSQVAIHGETLWNDVEGGNIAGEVDNTASSSSGWQRLFRDGGNGNDYWDESYNHISGSDASDFGNHALTWHPLYNFADGNEGFGGGTNGSFVMTGGLATYYEGPSLLFSQGGCTNNAAQNVNYVIYQLTGTAFILTNPVTHWGAPAATITTPGMTAILKPGDEIIGSSCNENTNRPF